MRQLSKTVTVSYLRTFTFQITICRSLLEWRTELMRTYIVSSKRSAFLPSFFLADLAKQIRNKSETEVFDTLSHGLEAELLLQTERKNESTYSARLDDTLIDLALRLLYPTLLKKEFLTNKYFPSILDNFVLSLAVRSAWWFSCWNLSRKETLLAINGRRRRTATTRFCGVRDCCGTTGWRYLRWRISFLTSLWDFHTLNCVWHF